MTPLEQMDLVDQLVVIVFGVILLIAMQLRLHMDVPTLAAQRLWRWYRRFLGIAYLVAFVLIGEAMAREWISQPIEVILAVSSMALLGMVLIWVGVREIRAADEFVQRVAVETYALGFALSIVMVVARGQLMGAGIISGLEWVFATPYIIFYAYVFSRSIVYLRYR